MGKRIFIHAGAHRTGTSSFQNCLALNRARLDAGGYDLAYPSRDGAPGGELALRLPQPGTGAAKAEALRAHSAANLAEISPRPGRDLILSEENLPGRMIHFYGGEFFPAAAKRFEMLAGLLPGEVEHILYVTRPYDALFISAYRKRSEDNPVDPFEEIAPAMAGFAGGWPEVVAAMQAALRPKRMTVIDYSARGQSRDLLGRLLGLEAGTFEEPARDLNVSATDAALIALQARYRAGERLSRAQWQAVIAEHAGAREDRGYARFTPGQAARLRRRYARSLERIAAMDGVDLIR